MLDPANGSACPHRPARAGPYRIGRALAVAVALVATWLPAGCDGEPDAPAGLEPPDAAGPSGAQTPPAAPAIPRERVRELASRGASARPEIERLLQHPHPEVREEAALAYPRVAIGTAAPGLARLATEDPETDVRAAAVTAIGHMRAMDEMEAILTALDDPDLLVRRRAADAASRITGQRYDVNMPPDQWRRTVDDIRALWKHHGDTLRTYHKGRHPPTGG